MPATIDFGAIQRGDTEVFQITWKDALDAPLDLSGLTQVITFKLNALLDDSESDLVLSKTFEANDVDAQNGIGTQTLYPSDSLKLCAGVIYFCGVKLITPSTPEPIETTYLSGPLTVEDA